MSGSNTWAEFANLYRLTRSAALDHDRAALGGLEQLVEVLKVAPLAHGRSNLEPESRDNSDRLPLLSQWN